MKLKYIITSVFVLATVLNVACSDRDNYTIPKGSFEEKPIVPPLKLRHQKSTEMEITGRRSRTICQSVPHATTSMLKQPISVLMSSGHTEYPTKSKAILDAAQEKGLYVNFGLYIKRETDGFDYNNAAAVKSSI